MVSNVNRQKIILDKLYKYGAVKVADLSNELNVHEETIRRDLKTLSAKWNIEIIYGGAILNNNMTSPSVHEVSMEMKRSKNRDEKIMIAKKAVSLIKPGDTIALNSGSTVEYILDYLNGITPLNIVTLNVHIASKASLMNGVDVYMPGGKVRGKSGAITGSGICEYIESFTIDKCFCGVSAVNLGKGVCHPNMEEVEGNKSLVKASRECYIVSDSTKMNQTALFKMIDFDDINGFIVDQNFPDEYREYFLLHDIKVI